MFSGSKRLTESIQINDRTFSVGQLLLSPTRTYLPVIKKILATHRDVIDGMIHCTGGGQGKVMKFVQNKHVIKNNLFDLPPVFEMIKKESGTDFKEMYLSLIHISEPTRPRLISYAVFCLKKKK